jgi:hypothetical protein
MFYQNLIFDSYYEWKSVEQRNGYIVPNLYRKSNFDKTLLKSVLYSRVTTLLQPPIFANDASSLGV